MTDDSDGDDASEDLGVSYRAGSKGPDREDMMASYLPEQDDWLAKTILELNDPGRIAALGQFDTMFPEVEDLQPVIDEFLDQLLRGRTSTGGASRDDYRKIFTAMYGGAPEDDTGSKLAAALAADLEDD